MLLRPRLGRRRGALFDSRLGLVLGLWGSCVLDRGEAKNIINFLKVIIVANEFAVEPAEREPPDLESQQPPTVGGPRRLPTLRSTFTRTNRNPELCSRVVVIDRLQSVRRPFVQRVLTGVCLLGVASGALALGVSGIPHRGTLD